MTTVRARDRALLTGGLVIALDRTKEAIATDPATALVDLFGIKGIVPADSGNEASPQRTAARAAAEGVRARRRGGALSGFIRTISQKSLFPEVKIPGVDNAIPTKRVFSALIARSKKELCAEREKKARTELPAGNAAAAAAAGHAAAPAAAAPAALAAAPPPTGLIRSTAAVALDAAPGAGLAAALASLGAPPTGSPQQLSSAAAAAAVAGAPAFASPDSRPPAQPAGNAAAAAAAGHAAAPAAAAPAALAAAPPPTGLIRSTAAVALDALDALAAATPFDPPGDVRALTSALLLEPAAAPLRKALDNLSPGGGYLDTLLEALGHGGGIGVATALQPPKPASPFEAGSMYTIVKYLSYACYDPVSLGAADTGAALVTLRTAIEGAPLVKFLLQQAQELGKGAESPCLLVPHKHSHLHVTIPLQSYRLNDNCGRLMSVAAWLRAREPGAASAWELYDLMARGAQARHLCHSGKKGCVAMSHIVLSLANNGGAAVGGGDGACRLRADRTCACSQRGTQPCWVDTAGRAIEGTETTKVAYSRA
ncbi:hypothetical protein Rsub_11189 [Raphidocelis subcapitata]|uniref:Uncharacterized protein n=1 Tax=Raphidocelis subcapitata TaxID=307507 RepID=A0A2V0PEA1_9CHLO|nr:hypothetical protein Rsub_11189 [Raphidocelis subcapitata]|eukprot:GBF97839.1 hypothetical protein Rsub_11189 [Raphidocelis subcapitata]